MLCTISPESRSSHIAVYCPRIEYCTVEREYVSYLLSVLSYDYKETNTVFLIVDTSSSWNYLLLTSLPLYPPAIIQHIDKVGFNNFATVLNC